MEKEKEKGFTDGDRGRFFNFRFSIVSLHAFKAEIVEKIKRHKREEQRGEGKGINVRAVKADDRRE